MKIEQQSRFTEPWYTIGHFAQTVYVRCPKCQGKALVKGESRYLLPWKPVVATLVCFQCGHTHSLQEGRWHGAVVASGRRVCGRCGHKWIEYRQRFATPPSHLPSNKTCACDICGVASPVELTWHREVFIGHAQDPYFGYALYLQTTINGHIFWCYNKEYVAYLQAYIRAILRERDRLSGKYSVITNLPKWVKSAKYRDDVLRALAKFEKELLKA